MIIYQSAQKWIQTAFFSSSFVGSKQWCLVPLMIKKMIMKMMMNDEDNNDDNNDNNDDDGFAVKILSLRLDVRYLSRGPS